jgi:septum formation protein
VPFHLDPADIEEPFPDSFASHQAIVDWVQRLAVDKAAAVAGRYAPGQWVLGADTTVVLGHEVLNKPADEAEAEAMLTRLQGRTHTVMTAVALLPGGGGEGVSEVVETEVTFFPLSPAEVRAYVAAGESLDKAGAYAAQGRGALIIERLHGCYFNVVGLPLATVARLLAEVGIDVWAPYRDAADGKAGAR